MQQSDYEIVGKFGFESRTISSKSITLGIFFCYTTTDEYPVGSRKVDKLSVQIVIKKKIGIFGYDFADIR